MLIVTCAVIRNEENQVLIVQRGESTDHPFKWEFPGGKLVPGETEEECIIREIDEELSVDIVICGRLTEVEHDYGHKQIKLIPFICDTLDEMPVLSEHIDFKWLDDKDLMSVDFSEADIFVARDYLNRQNSGTFKNDQPISGSENLAIDKDLQAIINNMMSMTEAEWVAASAIENPVIFVKLYEYSFSPDNRLSFRASWTLSKVCDKYPEMIYPYLSKIVDSLAGIDNESVLRSFLRILSLTDIDKINARQQGILADFTFNQLSSGFSAIAVKAYSMEILYRLTLIYPDLANELSTSIRLLMEDGSAGITSRGRAILRKLADMPVTPRQNKSSGKD